MNRVAFRLTVQPERLEEYLARHAPIWPEVLAELVASGRVNYSLFLDRERSTLFGYYEVDDDQAARAYLAQSEVVSRWEASMAEFFTDVDGRADQAATALSEIFNLNDQLRELDAATPGSPKVGS